MRYNAPQNASSFAKRLVLHRFSLLYFDLVLHASTGEPLSRSRVDRNGRPPARPKRPKKDVDVGGLSVGVLYASPMECSFSLTVGTSARMSDATGETSARGAVPGLTVAYV